MAKGVIKRINEKIYCNWWVKEFEKAEEQEDYRRQRRLCLSMIARYCPEDKRDKMIKNPIVKSLATKVAKDMIIDNLVNPRKNNYT